MNSSISRAFSFDVRSHTPSSGRFIALLIAVAAITILSCTTALVRADGITWTTRTSAADNNWLSITWGGPAGQEKFVAVSTTGTGNRVMTSPDGITWTSRTSAADNEWRDVAWGGTAGQEKFVAVASTGAVANTGTGTHVMTSPDGITWTTRTSAANNDWRDVAWGGPAGQEKFVAVSGTGTNNRVMTSPDGITWTTRTSASNNYWNSVTWGGPAGQETFVAVSNTGTGTRVMTSADGITWTTRTSAADNNWNSVTSGGTSGQERFVAVASTGTGTRVMSSADGITWTTRTSAFDGSWRAVGWGGPAGQEKYVAIAGPGPGAGNRVMTSGFAASTPSAPTLNSIASGDSSLTITFSAAADGGSPITNYKYSVDGTNYIALNPATTTSPFTISGLTNGTTYSVTIKAVNGIGDSLTSNALTGSPVAPVPVVSSTTTIAPAAVNTTATTTTVVPTATPSPAGNVIAAGEKKVNATSSELPMTGSNSSPLIALGMILLSLGLVVAKRRRVTS